MLVNSALTWKETSVSSGLMLFPLRLSANSFVVFGQRCLSEYLNLACMSLHVSAHTLRGLSKEFRKICKQQHSIALILMLKKDYLYSTRWHQRRYISNHRYVCHSYQGYVTGNYIFFTFMYFIAHIVAKQKLCHCDLYHEVDSQTLFCWHCSLQ